MYQVSSYIADCVPNLRVAAVFEKKQNVPTKHIKTTMAGIKKRKKKGPHISRRHKTRSHRRLNNVPATVSEPQEEIGATVRPNTQIVEDDEFVYEIEVATLDDALVPTMERVLDNTINRRVAIHYLFTTVFGTPTDRETWVGRNGVQASIRNSLHIPSNTSIIDVFEDILESRDNGVDYDPSIRPGRGRTAIIDVGTQQAQLIADVVEGCGSMTMATMVVNRYQQSIEEAAVTRAAVVSCIRIYESNL
jgi:hypothetical protein